MRSHKLSAVISGRSVSQPAVDFRFNQIPSCSESFARTLHKVFTMVVERARWRRCFCKKRFTIIAVRKKFYSNFIVWEVGELFGRILRAKFVGKHKCIL